MFEVLFYDVFFIISNVNNANKTKSNAYDKLKKMRFPFHIACFFHNFDPNNK